MFIARAGTEQGRERDAYNQIKGCSPKERISTYHTYIKDRNIHSTSHFQVFKFSPECIDDFFFEQQSISTDNGGFIKSTKVSLVKKVASYLFGSTISGAIEIVARVIHAIFQLVMVLLDSTLGLFWECAKGLHDLVLDDSTTTFGQRFTRIKDNIKSVFTDINQIARNTLRTLPVVGHFVGQAFDHLELAVIDGGERVAALLTCKKAATTEEKST